MMMMMVMVTMMVNVCDDCYLEKKVILAKEVMSCDVSPVAMFFHSKIILKCKNQLYKSGEVMSDQFEPFKDVFFL